MGYICLKQIILISGENNFIVDGHLNETFDEIWDNQEQIFNGLLENYSNDTNIVEKRLRLI